MEEQMLNAAVLGLVQITGVGNASAWKEQIYIAWRARKDNVDLNQAGFALALLDAAKAGKLSAVMDPFTGLRVGLID